MRADNPAEMDKYTNFVIELRIGAGVRREMSAGVAKPETPIFCRFTSLSASERDLLGLL